MNGHYVDIINDKISHMFSKKSELTIVKVGLIVAAVTAFSSFCQIFFLFSEYKLALKNNFNCFLPLSIRSLC
jgi:hypothetical protein